MWILLKNLEGQLVGKKSSKASKYDSDDKVAMN